MDSETKERKNQEDEVAPSSAITYLDPQYWNERFAKEEHYEWLKDYSHFRHLILEHIHPNSSVLELGCGNSQLSDEMYKNGIKNITCTDLSPVAVEKVQKRLLLKEFKEVKVLVADMLDLHFLDETFDVVIEKGTMDVLFVDSGDPWNPNPATVSKVAVMLQGIHRILKPDGVYISISFGQGTRTLNNSQPTERQNFPTICLLQDELEGEDYLFRTNLDDDIEDSKRGEV
ncbi:EEF1A lysine methyltransferase 4 [Bienertia sinuspersici]